MKKSALFILFVLLVSALNAQQKYALVIGNGAYTGISKLNNPVNDANDMTAALRGLGFTVNTVLNGSLEQMENAVRNLQRQLGASSNSYGFFFYAGHGVQVGGENYLIPVDSNIQSEAQLRLRAVSLRDVMESLSNAGNELNMVVLDACRDNPFSWNRSGARGLTVVTGAPSGSIVMYATSANSVAEDGNGRNGLFTGCLLDNLKTSGLSVYEIFDRTMGDVIKATGGRQNPELSLRFSGANSAYLGSRPVQPAPQPTPQPSPSQTVQPTSVPVTPPMRVSAPEMVLISGGTFQMGSPSNEADRKDNEKQHQVTVGSFYMGKYEVTQKEYQEVMGMNNSYFNGDNLPVENVNWYQAVNYCNRLSQRDGLTPAYTVNGTDVTWNQNANGYRLPTEAEWEYACRAGTTTPFNTGNNITTNQANFKSLKTTEVGSFAPNPWGLYDMHGNVWEWCWDIYDVYVTKSREDIAFGYSMYLVGGSRDGGAQADPKGVSSGSGRVVRGGSWYNTAQDLRSAYRFYYTPSSLNYGIVGFRVARNG